MSELNVGKIKDITGQRFGKLVVQKLSRTKKFKSGACAGAIWLCKCDCGNEKEALYSSLRNGNTKSCGCLKNVPNKDKLLTVRFLHIRNGARKRNLEFSLSKDDVKSMIFGKCYYCNKEPNNHRNYISKRYDKLNEFVYNGIDRVDNSKGYVIGNVVGCCRECNTKKGSVTIDMCRKILEFTDSKEKA